MPNVIIGVDAGGTKTTVAQRMDEGPVHTVSAAGANAATVGPERAAASIGDLIEQSLDGAQPHAIFVGMAGGGTPEIASEVHDSLSARFDGARVRVRDDAQIALRANVPDGDGVVLIAGTGSIAYAEYGSVTFRCGGFGYLLGDEGGGFSIGRAAIDQLLRAYDERGPQSDFTLAVEQHLGVRSAAETIATVYGAPYPVTRIAEVASVVIELAGSGDRAALKIVQAAALSLSDLAKAIVRKANLGGTSAPIAFSGGLLSGNSILSYLLETRLLNECPSMPIVKTAKPPVYGALLLAERLMS